MTERLNRTARAGDAGLIPGSGNLLEENMTTHSSILALKIPWTEGLGDYSLWGQQESDPTS